MLTACSLRADCVAVPFARSYGMIRTPCRIGRRPGGLLIVATFVLDGPTACSGLHVARRRPEAQSAALVPRGSRPTPAQRVDRAAR